MKVKKEKRIKTKYRKESDLKRQILKYLAYCGIFAWNNRNVGVWNAKYQKYIPSQIKGISDIIGILPDGRFLAIEVKREGNKLTEWQKRFLNEINMRKGVGIVAYSVEDVEIRLIQEKIIKKRM